MKIGFGCDHAAIDLKNELLKYMEEKGYECVYYGTNYDENGEIIIENEVIAQYAGHAALECFGIVGMATISMKDGIAKLLKGDSISKGVNVVIGENNELSIDFHIIVAYGVSISTVCDNLISTVQYSIEEMTGMKVKAINIFVEGVRVID